jgi:hypothetical protein
LGGGSHRTFGLGDCADRRLELRLGLAAAIFGLAVEKSRAESSIACGFWVIGVAQRSQVARLAVIQRPSSGAKHFSRGFFREELGG